MCMYSIIAEKKFNLKGGILYIHVYTLARRCEISNLKAISYIYILIDDRDSIALYDDRSMTSAE